MKQVFVAALFLFGLSAHAYVGKRLQYYCTLGNPFTDGISGKYSVQLVSDTENPNWDVTGFFAGKQFAFSGKPSINNKNGILTWSSSQAGIKVEVQRPGPYDGLQDSLWGKITVRAASKALNCYSN